jgi:shikimate kinase
MNPPTCKRIFVIGMPGCGKSTEGKILAKKLGWNFIDLDKKIESEMGSDIQSIFKMQGEAYFRELERKALIQLKVLDNAVIACGGGTIAFHNNMQWIKENGFSIYLRAEPRLLLRRILSSKTQRPLFEGLNEEEILVKIKELLEKRGLFFEQADISIDLPKSTSELTYIKASEAFMLAKKPSN